MNKLEGKKWFLGNFFLVTLLLYATIVYAADDIGQYRILLATCTTTQQAESIQQNIASLNHSLEYITSLGYSVSAYIIANNGEYKVYVGNYPTYGEARYIYRAFVQQGYQGAIEQISAPIPDPETITGTADVIYSQASTFESEKDYARSLAYYTAFINQYPTDTRSSRAFIQIGICKTKLNDFTGALAVFQTVANSDSPLAAEAQWRIGYAYLSLYQRDSAQAAFTLVTSRFPDSTVAADAKERLKAFISSGPDDAVYKQAMFAIAAKKYSIAVEYLNQYTTNYPTAARIDEAYLRLANCKINLGDKAGAFDGYKQVIRYPKSRFAKDACGELAKLAVSIESIEYIDSAIDALRQSPCLNPSNQELGGFFQTYIAWLIHEKVPGTPGGKLKAPYTTLADESTCWEAIAECRKVKERYPNASRYDLARSALMEVESFCRFDNETTVIELGKQVVATYPDQRKVACYAQHLIARAYENIKDYEHALEGYQTLIETYTEADNITTADDLIAMALLRKAECLQVLDRSDEAKAALQEIVQNHERSSMIIWAKQELEVLKVGAIMLSAGEMQQLIGSGNPCGCGCGRNNCICPQTCTCTGNCGCGNTRYCYQSACVANHPCGCGGGECICTVCASSPSWLCCWVKCQTCYCGDCQDWGCECPKACPCGFGNCNCGTHNCGHHESCYGQQAVLCNCGGGPQCHCGFYCPSAGIPCAGNPPCGSCPISFNCYTIRKTPVFDFQQCQGGPRAICATGECGAHCTHACRCDGYWSGECVNKCTYGCICGR